MVIVCYALNFYILILLVRIVLSWFPMSDRGAMASIQRFLYAVTEPVLGPLRSILPPVRMGGVALDLSPLIVLVVLNLITARICS